MSVQVPSNYLRIPIDRGMQESLPYLEDAYLAEFFRN